MDEKEKEQLILELRKLCLEIDEKVLKLRGLCWDLGKLLNKDFGKGWLKVKKDKSYKDLDINAPFIINFMPDQTGGHAILRQLYVEGEGLGGKTLTYGCARDAHLELTFSGGIENPEEIHTVRTIVTEPFHRVSIPKGDFSRHSDIVILLPKFSKDLPDKIASSAFGQMLKIFIEVLDVKQSVIKALEEGSKTKSQVLDDINTTGEMTEKNLKRITAITKNILSSSVKETEFTPPFKEKKLF